MKPVDTCIVGAGPAGLAVAARLRKAGVSYTLIERGPKAGWSWHNHYERLHLHTIKEFSHLPFLPFPEAYPRYVSRGDFAKYMEDYASTLQLDPQFEETLFGVQRTDEGWQVKTCKREFTAQRVVFATGYNRIPNMPAYEGLDDYKREVMHSQDYRHARDLAGKDVLVIGMGNTGAEIALDLCDQGASAFISVRNPVNIIPRDFLGRPAQKTAIMLNKLPEGLRDSLGNLLQKLTIGDLSKYGLPSPEYSPSYQVREHGRIPVIDLGTVAEIKKGAIKVLPGILRFESDQIVFDKGLSQSFDQVIFATGYHSKIEEFLPEVKPLLNKRGQPDHLWYQELPGIYFIGFAAPSTGILRSIYQNSEALAEDIISHQGE